MTATNTKASSGTSAEILTRPLKEPLSTHLVSRSPVHLNTRDSLGSRAPVNGGTGGQVFLCLPTFPEPVPTSNELRLGIDYNRAHQAWIGDAMASERLAECGVMKTKRNPVTGESVSYPAWCYNHWLCLRCGPAYWADARRRVMGVLEPWLQQGGGGYFVTIKTTHTRKTPCLTSMNNLQTVWRGILKTREWRDMKDAIGIELVYRAVEVSLDENGLHPHIHALILTETPPSEIRAQAFETYLTERYEEISTEKAIRVPDGPVRVKSIYSPGIGNYVTKGSLTTITDLAKLGLNGEYWATNTLIGIAAGTQSIHGATFSKHDVWGAQGYR